MSLFTGGGSLSMYTNDYDQTPKADYYADQLRAQARRISQSQGQGGFLNPARYQPKPVPDIKSSIVSSRPVDRPPRVQEAQPIIPVAASKETPAIYRSNNVSKGLNLVGLQSQNVEESKSYTEGQQGEYNRDCSQRGYEYSQQYSPNAPQNKLYSEKTCSPNAPKPYENVTPKGSSSSYSHSPQASTLSNSSSTQNPAGLSPSSSGTTTPSYQPQQQQHSPQNNTTTNYPQQQQHSPQNPPFANYQQQQQPNNMGVTTTTSYAQQQHHHHHSPQNSNLSIHHSPQNSLASSAFGGSVSTAPSSHHSPQASFASTHVSAISNTTSGYHSPKSSFSEQLPSPGKEEEMTETPIS